VKTIASATFLLLLLCPSLHSQSKRGTVCVGPISSEKPSRALDASGIYNPQTLTVRIDKEDPIVGPHQDCVKIGSLDLGKRHLIVITSDGKPIQSLWFRFEGGETEECLEFDSYHLITLSEKKHAPWCKCK